MEEKGPLEIMDKKGWREFDQLADEAEEILEKHGDIEGFKELRQMIIAVRARDLKILRQLAYGVVFPLRTNVCQILKLLQPTQANSEQLSNP